MKIGKKGARSVVFGEAAMLYKDQKMDRHGTGSVAPGIVIVGLAAICCGAPFLIIAFGATLGAVGLSIFTGSAALLLLIAISVGFVSYGLFKRRQNTSGKTTDCCAADAIAKTTKDVVYESSVMDVPPKS